MVDFRHTSFVHVLVRGEGERSPNENTSNGYFGTFGVAIFRIFTTETHSYDMAQIGLLKYANSDTRPGKIDIKT